MIRSQLPASPTTFVGRARELVELQRKLAGVRLLTLVGPGGCGKTRLAMQLCHDLAREPRQADGMVWCDLGPVSDPAQVAAHLASALQVDEQAGRWTVDLVCDALADRGVLVVLDNCEHVLAACAALAQALLKRCPHAQILATSIQPLGLPAETVWPVPPLSVPGPESSLGQHALSFESAQPEADGVRLFVERAQHVSPSFALNPENVEAVTAICRRLDGMPLAIELAAARVQLLSPVQIAERLDDSLHLLTRGLTDDVPRHHTLRATLDWSYALLGDTEQRLLRRLSVLAGPFTLGMVEAICAHDLDANALDVLSDLNDKSLLITHARDARGVARFRLLETVRQYARERLEASGEAASIRNRYLVWCAAWTEDARAHLTRPERGDWLAQFEWLQDHCRASLRWACTSRQAEPGLRLANALVPFWLTGGMAEGRAWIEELLNLEKTARPEGLPRVSDRTRAWALFGAGRLAVRVGDDEDGARRGAESLALFRASGDQLGILSALNLLALAAKDTNDYRRAEDLYAEGLALSRSTGNTRMTGVLLVNQGLMYYEQQDYRRTAPLWAEAQSIAERFDYSSPLDNLACLAMMQGDLARAQRLLEQEWQIASKGGDKHDVALTLMDLGECARRRGDLERAQALLADALERHRQMSNATRIGETLVYLAHAARNGGRLDLAKELYEQSLPHLQKSNYTRYISHVQTGLGMLAALQGHDDEALLLLRDGLSVARRGNHRLCGVEALEEIAGLRLRQGREADAARLVGAAAAEREKLGAPVPTVEQARYTKVLEALRAALGDDVFAKCQSDARTFSLDEVVADVLRETPGAAEGAARAAPSAQSGPALRVYALGPTRVLVGERALASGDWRYAKSRELLFYLLLNPPAVKERIGLDLWPDASRDQLRNIFHRTLHYLRRALGHGEWITHADDRYTLAPTLVLWCDVREFEAALATAQPLVRQGATEPNARARARHGLAEAVRLWRGDFLADLDAGDWAIARRESLRRAYLQALMDLGQMDVADARYADAADVYRQVLAYDEYFEAAHRELMRCYARLGESAQALRQYGSLQKLLRDELRAAPSPETLLLYERLRRGDDV